MPDFTIDMLANLDRAVDHEDMTPALAEIPSTNKVKLDYRIETDIHINGDQND